MTIDIDRLTTLLDRGADVQAAAGQARQVLQDAESALRNATGDAEAVCRARVDRRRAALAPLEKRAQAWGTYCNDLRAFAKKNGVEL